MRVLLDALRCASRLNVVVAWSLAPILQRMTESSHGYVSRGGVKLAAALDVFRLDPAELTCADLGANVGGFTDCLLQRGARHVFAVDTGYGTLDWKLRNDRRVTVLERANALHLDPTSVEGFAPCDLVVIDLGWTKQARAVPAALRWLSDAPRARIITLIKPQYEALPADLRMGRDRKGVLEDDKALAVMARTIESLPALGVRVLAQTTSPIRGGAARGKRGNVEYLALLERK